MAWKWYAVTSYKASVGGGSGGGYYAAVQLMGSGFYALLKFQKTGALPAATAPVAFGEQRFYCSMDFQQMAMVVDLLRNEKPIQFGWDETDPNQYHLMTGAEPIGEGDGVLAESVPA
jgi:hypothetical protein